MSIVHRWLALAASAPFLHVPNVAAAADALQYVVVPAVGQKVSIVRPRGQVGSNLGLSREWVPITEPTFDNAIFEAADDVLRAAIAEALPKLLRAGR